MAMVISVDVLFINLFQLCEGARASRGLQSAVHVLLLQGPGAALCSQL